jgi:hypothetical protein
LEVRDVVKKPFPAYLLRLLMDPRVSRQKKLAFPLIIFAYLILPDVLPFLPLDDLLFTILMVSWFTRSAEKDVRDEKIGKGTSSKRADKQYVDVQGEVVKDEGDDF